MIRRRRSLKLDGWRDLLDLDRLELATYAHLKLNEEILEYTVRPLMLTYAMADLEVHGVDGNLEDPAVPRLAVDPGRDLQALGQE